MQIEGFGHLNISKEDPESVEKVAKEMEALFLHELLKVMRKNVKGVNGLGGNVYTSMFDMELSRTLAERGLGLGEALEEQLTRLQEKIENAGTEPRSEEPSTSSEAGHIHDKNAINNANKLKDLLKLSDKRHEESLGGGES
jgi:flagellar protein FlgJ